MPWVTMPQISGKVYVPDKRRITPTKNPCPDCFACQQCSDERCNACCRSEAEDDRNDN